MEGYDEGCIEYVKSSLSSKGDDELDAIVASERSLHPDKCSQIESYQEVRLMVTALANTYRAEHSDDIDDLLERAGEIREAKVTGDADPALSRRMMAFVMGGCSACADNDSVAYKMTQEPLGGVVEVSHLATNKGDTRFSQNAGSRCGRSPRAHTRRGHWRNQAYGPNRSLRRRIWISDTIVTPSGKPYRVTDPSRVHAVTLR